jgi:hypothetical protein
MQDRFTTYGRIFIILMRLVDIAIYKEAYLKREVIIETLFVNNGCMTYFKRFMPFTLLCVSLFCLTVLFMTPTEAGAAKRLCSAKVGAYTPSLANGRAFSLGTANTNCGLNLVVVQLVSVNSSIILSETVGRRTSSAPGLIRVTTPSVRWKGCEKVYTFVRWSGRDLSGNWHDATKLSAPRKICF